MNKIKKAFNNKLNMLKQAKIDKKNDNRIMVISKENGGVSSARNEGIKKSNGKTRRN